MAEEKTTLTDEPTRPTQSTEPYQIIHGHVLDVLRAIPDDSAHCIVTSPPYFGLRDYKSPAQIWGGRHECKHEWQSVTIPASNGQMQPMRGPTLNPKLTTGSPYFSSFCRKCHAWRGQLGLEPTPELYVQHLVAIFHEAKRALRGDGTLWLNLGDTYWGSTGQAGQHDQNLEKRRAAGKTIQRREALIDTNWVPQSGRHPVLKPKDLCGIPWRVALALQADGLYLRSDIIWAKPNPMPESVRDRPTRSHEYLFLLTKSPRYYYDQDAIREPLKEASISRLRQNVDGQKGSYRQPGKINGPMKAICFGGNKATGYGTRIHSGKPWTPIMSGGSKRLQGHSGYFDANGQRIGSGKANKKSVWTIATQPFRGAHFATFPEKLVEPCIKAGCPSKGTVLDPFCGSGRTGVVSVRLGRRFIGIDLNPEYCAMTRKQIEEQDHLRSAAKQRLKYFDGV